jgi:hypothetical protein
MGAGARHRRMGSTPRVDTTHRPHPGLDDRIDGHRRGQALGCRGDEDGQAQSSVHLRRRDLGGGALDSWLAHRFEPEEDEDISLEAADGSLVVAGDFSGFLIFAGA